jgi:hypothetical protein
MYATCPDYFITFTSGPCNFFQSISFPNPTAGQTTSPFLHTYYTHTYTHTHTHTQTHIYIHTHTHTHKHTYIHTYIHIYMYVTRTLLDGKCHFKLKTQRGNFSFSVSTKGLIKTTQTLKYYYFEINCVFI